MRVARDDRYGREGSIRHIPHDDSSIVTAFQNHFLDDLQMLHPLFAHLVSEKIIESRQVLHGKLLAIVGGQLEPGITADDIRRANPSAVLQHRTNIVLAQGTAGLGSKEIDLEGLLVILRDGVAP